MQDDSWEAEEQRRQGMLAWLDAFESALAVLEREQPAAESDADDSEEDEADEALQEEQGLFSAHVLKVCEEHRDELVGVDFDGKTIDEMIAAMREARARSEKADATVDTLTGELYAAMADGSEADAALIVQLAAGMKEFAAVSQEQLDLLSFADRLRLVALVERWQNGLGERLLSQLPIELRREVE